MNEIPTFATPVIVSAWASRVCGRSPGDGKHTYDKSRWWFPSRSAVPSHHPSSWGVRMANLLTEDGWPGRPIPNGGSVEAVERTLVRIRRFELVPPQQGVVIGTVLRSEGIREGGTPMNADGDYSSGWLADPITVRLVAVALDPGPKNKATVIHCWPDDIELQ